ncbi:hypothetical protein FA95DRAFT_851501 [Auriscalpium vulgare]|uniref:Uncharacterized protein n=1 Tax=Auriscalpium vulgare TaxID=40419 RepID=A0ACB8R9S3_9AGAM|nr:hypothetical protein FA95DRAFT_851501 [Auriscalpium vulgare]
MCPPGPALPYPSYTPYSPFPPRPQFPPASPIERDDLAATSRAVESIVEGQQQATQGLITHLGHIRSAAERERRQHNTEHTAVVQHLQQLILALPDLCTAQVGIEQSVRALQARTGALQDAGVPTPRTADFKQRQTETQLRDLESSVTAIRNTAEALAEVLKIKIPYLGLPGQTFPTVAQPDSWNRWNSPLANNPPFVPAYPYGQPFPSTVPPAMRTTNPYAVYSPPWAGRPMNLEPFIPGQTPRSVHWPQACESPPKPLSTVSESTEPKSPAPALPGSPWGAPYVVSSAAAVRPPPLPTATYPNVSQVPPVDSDTASPSLTNESFTYASHPPVPPPVNFDFELFDSTSMSMAPMMRRARRQEKSKVAPAPAPVPVPTTDTNKPVQFHSLSQMVRNGSPMPLYSPSPPPGPSVPYPPSFGFGYAMDMPIMAPPRFDWEIQNPLVRPPSSGPQSIELVLPQPTDVVEASAETVKRAPSAASTIESLVQVLPCPPADESICTRTMPLYSPQDNARSRSPSESLCTDSSFLGDPI